MLEPLVIDASVAVKWFIEKAEQSVTEARSILELIIGGKISVIVPDLLLYELGNVFVQDTALSQVDTEDNFFLLSSLIQLELVAPQLSESNKIAALARRYKLTFYDAVYLHLAQEHGATLVTEDRELLATKLPQVKSLKQVKLPS